MYHVDMCAHRTGLLCSPICLVARSFVRLINRIPNLLIDFFVCKTSFCNQRKFQRSFPTSFIIWLGSNFISLRIQKTHSMTRYHTVLENAKPKKIKKVFVKSLMISFVAQTYQSEISLMRSCCLWGLLCENNQYAFFLLESPLHAHYIIHDYKYFHRLLIYNVISSIWSNSLFSLFFDRSIDFIEKHNIISRSLVFGIESVCVSKKCVRHVVDFFSIPISICALNTHTQVDCYSWIK